MGHVTHLVPFAEANDGGEIVLHDPEMIAMVRDVSRQEQRISTSDDSLLAQVGRTPIDFERQLIRLHDARWLDESLADLREKGEIAVRLGVVIGETCVGELRCAESRGKLHERTRGRVVPHCLCAAGSARHGEQ